MPSPNNDDEDIGLEICQINMGQTMAIMAATVRAVISTFIKPEDSEEDKTKLALLCFGIFLHQYIAVAKKPELYAPILEIIIKEVCHALPRPTPV